MIMDPIKVGLREFRAKLATYVLESETPIAITRLGDTVGYFIPVRRKRTEAERQALTRAAVQLEEMLQAHGVSEEEIVSEFKRLRADKPA
jgi:hypothetical protein